MTLFFFFNLEQDKHYKFLWINNNQENPERADRLAGPALTNIQIYHEPPIKKKKKKGIDRPM